MKEKMLTIIIPEELHRKFKQKTASEGISMKEIIVLFIESYVSDM